MANTIDHFGINMEIFIATLVGGFIGYGIRGILYEYARLKLLKELDGSINEKMNALKEKIVPSRIEEENGVLFLYHRETNEFLGQGNSFEDLENVMKEKFPEKLFNVPQEEINKYLKD